MFLCEKKNQWRQSGIFCTLQIRFDEDNIRIVVDNKKMSVWAVKDFFKIVVSFLIRVLES